MKNIVFLIVNVLFLQCMAGCANVHTVRSDLRNTLDSDNSITSRYFNADNEQLKKTVLTVMQDYGLKIQRVEDATSDEFMIIAEKGITAWSWGEVVGVMIKKVEEDTSLVKVISKRKLSTNITAKDWKLDILSGISARTRMLTDRSNKETYDISKQDEDWLKNIDKAVSTIFSFESKPSVAIGCDGRFGDYISSKIMNYIGKNNPNISIIASGNDLRYIIDQQKLTLSGLYDEKTAVQVGKLVGATYLLICTPYFKANSDKVELHCKVVNIENGKFLGGGLIVYIPITELPQG